jgi:hypothetical protein
MKGYLFIALACAISALAQQVHYYPYDDTDAVSYRLECPPKESVLRLAQSRIVPDFLCGSYRGMFDFTAGFTLHVFPDKTVMIEEWVDIGLPKLVAEGRWSISDKGDVLFIWKKRDFGDACSEKFFNEQYGECRKMKLFLCFTDKSVDNVLLVSEELIGAKIKHAYWRSKAYVDWGEIQKKLKKKKG